MRSRRFLTPVIVLALLAGAGFTAYGTRDDWRPYVFPTPSDSKPGDGHTEEEHGARADRVKLSPQAQKNLALDVDTPTPQEYWRTMLIPGVVVDRPGESDRGVTSKLAGVVTRIRAKPGDTVKAGEELFTLELTSELLKSTQADSAKAAGKRVMSSTNWSPTLEP